MDDRQLSDRQPTVLYKMKKDSGLFYLVRTLQIQKCKLKSESCWADCRQSTAMLVWTGTGGGGNLMLRLEL